MAKLLSDYVKIYEGTLSPGRCQALIDKFEASPALHEPTPPECAFKFVELNVSRHWPEVETHTFGVMMSCIRRYWEAVEVGPHWPQKVDLEKIRLKRYMPGGQDRFPTHVDVTNSEESKRFLTAILYLNDPGGGETIFPGLAEFLGCAHHAALWLAGEPPSDPADETQALLRSKGLEHEANRFNVAITRAQCLAIVVQSPRLQDVSVGSIEDLIRLNLFARAESLAENVCP